MTIIRVLAAAAAVVATVSAQAPAHYDLLLRGGTVVDGTGLPAFRADVAIAGDAVARIGALAGARASVEIDVTGLHVAPGFVNIHSHAMPNGLPRAENMLTQGVTTEILNADGSGPVDIAAQLDAAAKRGLAVNVGANIGFNTIWSQVVGAADRRPTSEEIAKMRALLVAGLEQGAFGVSAGLDYKPAYFAQLEEVVQVVDAARSWRTYFTNHDRVIPETGFSARAGVLETIAIGERAGVTPVVTHMKVAGRDRGTADVVLGRMNEATTRGAYTAADAYPYLAGQTALGALIIPAWAQDGGRAEMLKRFADPELRARIAKEAEETMNARFVDGAAGVFVPQLKLRIADVMRDMQVSAGEAVIRLLEKGNPATIAFFGDEPDLVKILQHPTTSVACDCGAIAEGGTHPRFYGTYPRVLGRYVREQKVLTLESAIRKMTGLPAVTTGFVDRGVLAAGMAADVTVFDAEQVIDHATFEQPTLRSTGIRHVIVNGRFAVRDGAPTGEQAGRTLSRARYMPSRAMNGPEARSVTRRGPVGDADIMVDLSQVAGARSPKGSFRLRDDVSKVALEMTESGWLQTAGDWASFTGRGRLRSNEPEQSISVVIDGAAVVVRAGDAYRLVGELRR